MALSDKMKEATMKAKKGTAAENGRLEKAAQKAGAVDRRLMPVFTRWRSPGSTS
jgi:hypothetical protein